MLNQFHKTGSYNVYKNILKNISKLNYYKQYETRDMKSVHKNNQDYTKRQNEITNFVNNKKKIIKRPKYLKMNLNEFIQFKNKNILQRFEFKLFGR